MMCSYTVARHRHDRGALMGTAGALGVAAVVASAIIR